MDWLDALILGIIQGLTEYLPVSSSGHIEIVKEVLGVDLPAEENLQFSVIVHAATVLSTIVVLWPMFAKLCKSFFTFRRDNDFYYVCKILVSCIPVGIVGVFLKDTVEEIFGSGLLVVGICLMVTALLLTFAYLSDLRAARRNVGKLTEAPAGSEGREIGWIDSIVIGLAQAVAVLPGLSRSGTTIATGILLGNKRAAVAHFSFLMVILPILGECLLDVKDMIGGEAAGSGAIGILPLIIGFVSAFLVGCVACRWMIDLVKKGKLIWFAIYCVIMGVVCIVW